MAKQSEHKTMIYIGIDNGISGGLAAIPDRAGVSPLGYAKMPIQRSRKGNEIDVRALHLWLTEITCGNLSNAVYLIEEPAGSKSAKAGVSMAGSFHAIRGFFDAKFLRYERVTHQRWQKAMLPGCKAGDTKARALECARRLWPEETFLASPLCKVPNDGIVDALLIAEWGRRARL